MCLSSHHERVNVLSVAASTSAHDVIITVSYTVGSGPPGTAQIATTVQKPTSMGFVSVNANAANTCVSGQAGWRKVITWQVQDQLQPPGAIIFALPTWDTMNITSGQNGCSLTLSGTNPGGTVGPTGLWQHTYQHCTTLCVGGTCQTSGTQKYFVNGFEIGLPFTFACSSITVSGH